MPSIWNKSTRMTIMSRLAKLESDSKPDWGKLTASELLCHLADQLRVAKGCWEVKLIFRGFWTRQPLKWLGIYVLPSPKNLKGPAEMFVTKQSTWQADLQTLHDLLDDLVSRSPQAVWGKNPYFGKVTKNDWGVLIYRHFDHHLKQFGV